MTKRSNVLLEEAVGESEVEEGVSLAVLLDGGIRAFLLAVGIESLATLGK